jgi:hypothetical protein
MSEAQRPSRDTRVSSPAMRFLPFLVVLCSCSSWALSDARWASDSAITAQAALGLCAPDAGSCEASQVRALEEAQLCGSAATLARHGLPISVDAGECR